MGGGSGASNSVVEQNLLPAYAQTYVKDYLARSQTLSKTGYQTYQGLTYAAQDQNEVDGIAALKTRATNGHPIITKGEQLLRDILDGNKLNINPKLNDSYSKKLETLIQQFEEEELPRLDQKYNLVNGYGSDAHQADQAKLAENLMARLTEVGAQLYYNDYVTERGRQSESLGYTIQYGTQDVINAELLKQVGLYIREYQQGSLEDAYKKWMDEQVAITRRLEYAGNSIRAMVGAQSQTVEPYYRPSTMSQIAGFAFAGAGLATSIYSNMNPKISPYAPLYTSPTNPNPGPFGMPATSQNPSPLGMPSINSSYGLGGGGETNG